MRALTLRSLDGPDAAEVADVPEPPSAEMVVIDVEAAGLGFADVLISRGLYQVRPSTPFVPGMEVAGVVRRTVPGIGLLVGARVTALTGVGGGCAERASVPPAYVFPRPAALDAVAGASLVVNYHTAYFALHRRARLKPGETVLVQGAGGGLGQAVVQVAKGLGATVIALGSSERKREAARAAGADEVLAPDAGWAQQVRALTGGHGVNVLVDPVGGDRFDDNVRVLAPEGRLVVVGFAAGQIPTVKANRLLLRNVSVLGAVWREFVTDNEPGYARRTATALDEMIERGHVAPRPGGVFPLEQGAEAMRALAEQRLVGRVVLTL